MNILGQYLESDKRAVAIVGSRQATSYGIKIAYKFSYELAKAEITIVSGLARGIDTVAHTAALEAGGRTIAVLGSGLDVIYPSENKQLAKRIIKKGALMSQFKNGTPPLGPNFLARNRVIAELSLAVLVVGGARRSGTISTATHAADLGKEVFAIPGPIGERFSEASIYLIEQGARVAKDPNDIIEYVNEIT